MMSMDRCEACGAWRATWRNALVAFAVGAGLVVAGLGALILADAAREDAFTVVNGHPQSLTDGDTANNRNNVRDWRGSGR